MLPRMRLCVARARHCSLRLRWAEPSASPVWVRGAAERAGSERCCWLLVPRGTNKGVLTSSLTRCIGRPQVCGLRRESVAVSSGAATRARACARVGTGPSARGRIAATGRFLLRLTSLLRHRARHQDRSRHTASKAPLPHTRNRASRRSSSPGNAVLCPHLPAARVSDQSGG